MQKDIVQKINLLIEMSDTNNNYESLKEELRILEIDIAKCKDSISDLTKSMVDTKYMQASERIIDENIKISLENKIANYEVSMKDIKSKISEISLEEEEYHQMICELETEITKSKRFLESLELKLKTIGSKDKSVYSFYEDLIDTTAKEIKTNETRLQVKQKAMESVQKRLESYAESRVSLEDKMQKDILQLEETKKSLMNSKSYIDEESRNRDEIRLKNLNESLADLEKRRLEILSDPAYIGREAIDLLVSDDRTSCLSKVRDLVSFVSTRPYMDASYDDLDELLEQAVQKRDEYANIIENKKYDGMDSAVLDQRIEFLKSRYEARLQEKAHLEEKIRVMDTELVPKIMRSITETKKTRDMLKSDIDEYKKVMDENNEYKTPKKKASLNAAFHRKCEELEQVNTIISHYESDLENVVTSSKVLEEKEMSALTIILNDIETEMKSIEKRKILDHLPKDILAVERDKSKLKSLSDDVENILLRKKYVKTARQLFDEIELSLGSLDYEEIQDKPVEEVSLDQFRIDSVEEDEEIIEEPTESVLEENSFDSFIPPSADIEPIMNLEKVEKETQEEKESFPPRSQVAPLENHTENAPERFKVVSVEPIEDTSESEPESLEEDDYMVNDFQDTDYISFNDLLEREDSDAD